MKAVAAGDEIAGELVLPPAWPKPDLWRLAAEIMDAHIAHLEQYLSAVSKPPRDESFTLLLAIDGDPLSHQLAKIDVMQRAAEGEIHAIVKHAFALHARAHPGLDQEIARPLLDQAGADAALDIVAAAILQDDGFDAGKMQEVRRASARQGPHPRSRPACAWMSSFCSDWIADPRVRQETLA